MKNIRDILKFGFKHINKHGYSYLLYIILSLLISLIGVFIPLITGQIVDLITGKNTMVSLQQLVGTFVALIFIQVVLSYITNLQYIRIQSESGYIANILSIEKIYNASYREVCNVNPSSLRLSTKRYKLLKGNNIKYIYCRTKTIYFK